MVRKGSPPEAGVQVSLEKAWVKTPLMVAKVSGSPEQSLQRTGTRSWPFLTQHPSAPSTDKRNTVQVQRRSLKDAAHQGRAGDAGSPWG